MEVSCCGAVIGCIGPLVAIRQGNGRGAVVVEGQVVLLSRDEGLASTIGRLLSDGDRIAQFHSAAELTDWSTPTVATVILDSQPHVRRLSYKHVRERYHGPLIMLLDMDERRPDLPPDGARRYLQRPFEVAELSSLLDTPVPELGSVAVASGPRLGGHHRRPGGPAAGGQPQRSGVVRAQLHSARRPRRRGRRGPDPADLHPGHPVGRRRPRRQPAAGVVGRLLPAFDPHQRHRLPGGHRGRGPDRVDQPHHR